MGVKVKVGVNVLLDVNVTVGVNVLLGVKVAEGVRVLLGVRVIVGVRAGSIDPTPTVSRVQNKQVTHAVTTAVNPMARHDLVYLPTVNLHLSGRNCRLMFQKMYYCITHPNKDNVKLEGC